MVAEREFSKTEVVVARVVCAIAGFVFAVGGWSLAAKLVGAGHIVGFTLTVIGILLLLAAAFAPRLTCAKAAHWILTHLT